MPRAAIALLSTKAAVVGAVNNSTGPPTISWDSIVEIEITVEAADAQLARRVTNDDAITILHEALERDPDNGRVLHDLAMQLLDQGAYADAEPLFRRALAGKKEVLGPMHPTSLLHLLITLNLPVG